MSDSVIFDAYYYDDAIHAWRSAATGRAVSTAAIQAEVQAHVEAGQAVIEELTVELNAGDITLPEWKMAVAHELKDMHGSFAMYGAGGRDAMSPSMWGRVGGNLADEYKHLQDFADGIANGTVSPAQALARAKAYGRASEQAYWRAFAETAPKSDPSLPLLRNVPKDGKPPSTCHGNCNCQIVRRKDGAYDWVTHPGEHCAGCLELATGGPYRLN